MLSWEEGRRKYAKTITDTLKQPNKNKKNQPKTKKTTNKNNLLPQIETLDSMQNKSEYGRAFAGDTMKINEPGPHTGIRRH